MKNRIYLIIENHTDEVSKEVYLDNLTVYNSGLTALKDFERCYNKAIEVIEKRYGVNINDDCKFFTPDSYFVCCDYADVNIVYQGRLVERILEDD